MTLKTVVYHVDNRRNQTQRGNPKHSEAFESGR